MNKVFIRQASYNPSIIRDAVAEMFDSMGPDWICRGDRILIKPNLLMAAAPDKGIVTHPMLCRAVAQYLLDKGAHVQVSDSPGVGSFRKLIIDTGYKVSLEGLDVAIKPFEGSVEVDIGEPFGRIPIARDAIEADQVINLAKLKTHAQMFLTLGVKNMFGCIVGLRKPEWHMRIGLDRRMFARLLVQIHQAVAPAFTIVDGITALEGQGPGRSGRPRELGLLVGGPNTHAVDKTICALLGLEPLELLTCAQAAEMGAFGGQVHVNGDIHIVDNFQFPDLGPLSIGPQSINSFLRQYVLQKPVVNNQVCKLCGECWNICPARAVTHNIKGIRFNYDSCIRCYCCLEMCPHGAIRAKEPLLGRLRRRLIRP